jgi:hypothetical protein
MLIRSYSFTVCTKLWVFAQIRDFPERDPLDNNFEEI